MKTQKPKLNVRLLRRVQKHIEAEPRRMKMKGSVLISKSGQREDRGNFLPWHENPFRLISWLDMNKFSARAFFKIGCLLGDVHQSLYHFDRVKAEGGSWPEMTPNAVKDWLRQTSEHCEKIALSEAAKCAKRIMRDMEKDEGVTTPELRIRIRELQELIGSEMDSQTFLWVPRHRAEFYSKDAEAMIGRQCCKRFKSIQRELEEAAKCYAAGRYTASAFHLMRSTEAGVKALAKAIGYTPPHEQWDLVFKRMKSEFALKPSQRPAHWQTHGDFLEMVWADLRAVSKAWRNDIAHLVDTYSEEEARNLLTVIPMFLRDLRFGK